MTKEELVKEAEEWLYNNLHSASEEDFIEAMVDIAEPREKRIAELEKENAELKSIAEFQQSSNMSRHFENKKLKEGLVVGSMWNKHLNSQNKALEEERDKYRDMTFDQREQLTKAKELLKWFVWYFREGSPNLVPYKHKVAEAEQFLKE